MKSLVSDEEDFSLPMTPMIDIVFLLLIFFLLATTINEEEVDLQVNLPGGTQGSAAGNAAGTRMVISVRSDGVFTLGGAPMAWDELKRRVLDAGRRQEKPRVFLRGDQEAPYGKVAQVLQLCQEAGIEQVNCEFHLLEAPRSN
ncbi:MAG: biopolymer transporter ExbD [Planctomycetota bacterium]|nr:biopolymer transporter ExbD [Planctomycetota bacterium]